MFTVLLIVAVGSLVASFLFYVMISVASIVHSPRRGMAIDLPQIDVFDPAASGTHMKAKIGPPAVIAAPIS